jgi:hypothetical protein
MLDVWESLIRLAKHFDGGVYHVATVLVQPDVSQRQW